MLLDAVCTQQAVRLELLACERETLLVWWDALLILDLGLDAANGVASLNIKGEGARQSLDEDLEEFPRFLVAATLRRAFIATASRC